MTRSGNSLPAGEIWRTPPILCSETCRQLSGLPDPSNGDPFDFGIGYRAVLDGVDVLIVTDENVFIYGPVRATQAIFFQAEGIEFLDGSEIAIGMGELNISTGDFGVGPIGIQIAPPPIEVISLPKYPLICACASTVRPSDVGGDVDAG